MAEYGLKLPAAGRAYVRPALLWGAIFGVIMFLIDYAPQLRAHSPGARKVCQPF